MGNVSSEVLVKAISDLQDIKEQMMVDAKLYTQKIESVIAGFCDSDKDIHSPAYYLNTGETSSRISIKRSGIGVIDLCGIIEVLQSAAKPLLLADALKAHEVKAKKNNHNG